MTMPCPTCGKTASMMAERPFCSQACQRQALTEIAKDTWRQKGDLHRRIAELYHRTWPGTGDVDNVRDVLDAARQLGWVLAPIGALREETKDANADTTADPACCGSADNCGGAECLPPAVGE